MKNVFQSLFLAAALLLSSAASADNTPHCDALDRTTNKNINIDTDLDFDDGDIVFREDGKLRMVITEERELFLDGERVALDARGQELVDAYYITFEEFIDDVADLAGDAAGLGVSAAMEAIAAVFRGDEAMEDFEQRIEERARSIEEQADSMCARLQRIEGIERELEAVVPGFVPRLFAQR